MRLADAPDPGAGRDGIPLDEGSSARESRRLLEGLARADTGSDEHGRIRERLVELHLPLVRQLARRYRFRSEPMEDTVQAGSVGLVKAIDRYEPERGAFLPFAVPDGDDAVTLADRFGAEDGALDLVEQRVGAEEALGELPVRERDILMFRFYGNMTQAQIGERIGISQMHVSRLLDRSLERLRQRLAADTAT